MTPTGVGYGDSAGRKRRGLSTPGELGVYGGLTLRIFSESTRFLQSGYSRSPRGFLHSGYSRNLLGFCLRMFSESTRFLHSVYSRRLRGFYTPDVLGVYEDSMVAALGRDAPRGCETNHAPLNWVEKG